MAVFQLNDITEREKCKGKNIIELLPVGIGTNLALAS